MPKLLEINHQRNEIIEEQRYSSTHIANILRLSRPKSMSSGDLKFAQIRFYEADLSMANLTNLDISNSDFVRVDVSKAVLKPAKFDNSFWGGVKWWEAAEISAPFLSYLIENAGTYTHGGEEDLLRGEGTPSVSGS